jgi:hypothetical protein
LAQAAPIPLPEPVITMALPSNSFISVSTSAVNLGLTTDTLRML